MTDAVQLARSVLLADGQPFITLSLAEGLPPVTVDTAVPNARRNYMRLAGAIHPDRLQSRFDKATEAFQCLVRAFECFADTKSRKRAAEEALRKAKAATIKPKATEGATTSAAAVARSTSPKKQRTTRKAEKPPKKQGKGEKSKRAARKGEESPSELESEEEESEEETEVSAAEEEAWEEWAAADTEPEVSTSRTPIGQPRVGGLYQHTTIGCPKCRSQWEPDSRPQYSLFMGHWGKKVHCQLCLFEFGCATALHNCPHCSAPFDYDVSMYDDVQTCKRCKERFGFPYYPVNQHLIDQTALEEWRERKDRKKAAEREARARARRGDASNAVDDDEPERTQLLIGTCIMDEMCPLCHQRVKNKHRSHVLECRTKSPAERAAAGKKSQKPPEKSVKVNKAVVKKAGASKTTVATKKVAPKASSKAKAAPTRRKRRRSGSDSSVSEASFSESEEDEISSESSFSDDEENDDYDNSD